MVLKKYLPEEQATIPGLDSWGGKTFLPLYKLYDGDKCVGTFTNIYEAARELERENDFEELAMAFDKNPDKFKAYIPKPEFEPKLGDYLYGIPSSEESAKYHPENQRVFIQVR